MSPQRSNRSRLLEGTLRCLERLPPEDVTARAIAEESGANLASITYHFGSKDNLVTMAVIEGLDRWLEEISRRLGDVSSLDPSARFLKAAEAMDATRRRHTGLARTFIASLSKAQHDASVRALLTEGFTRSRDDVAAVLGWGGDQTSRDTGGLVLALFNGLLLQALLDPGLVIEGRRLEDALARLGAALPDR
jgi:AcrR family transcriptional regulator